MCFDMWRMEVDEKKRLRTIVTKFFKRLMKADLAAGFTTWSFTIQREKRDAITIDRFRRRFLNQRLGKSLNSWRAHVGERKWLRNFLGRTLGGMQGVGFSTWRARIQELIAEEAAEERRLRIGAKFVARMKLAVCARSIRKWFEFASTRKSLRALMAR